MSKKTMKDYIKGVTPLNMRNVIITFQKEKADCRKIEQVHKNYLSFLDFSIYCAPTESNQPSVLDRKLKRRFSIIDRTIDLHGLTLLQALAMLTKLFAQFQSENIKNVLVITGGSSMRSSKIRLSFKQWISGELSKYVASYSQAKPNHGGEGAFYVILRRI